MYFDPQVNKQTFLTAGFKEAVGFITQLTNQEVIEAQDPRSFDKYWRSLTIYDFDVLTPEKLAVFMRNPSKSSKS